MKTLHKTIHICIILAMLFNLCEAQENFTAALPQQQSTLEERVSQSDLVIEGRVTSIKSFKSDGGMYTSALIRITKLFKGTISDSIIELVFNGGQIDSIVVVMSNKIGLENGSEGVFFLTDNKTKARLAKGLQSYQAAYGPRGYIGYHEPAYMFAHHVATCKGETYDDLEKDLFGPIEAITRVPRKILGQNMFERKAANGVPGSR